MSSFMRQLPLASAELSSAAKHRVRHRMSAALAPRGVNLRRPSPFSPVGLTPSQPRVSALASATHNQDDRTPSPQPEVQQQESVKPLLARASSVDEEIPFAEPLLRNLALGVGAGALAELAHVIHTAMSIGGGPTGLLMMPTIASTGALAPLFWLDHAVAIGVWAVLYALEASTVSKIISQHPTDPKSAAKEIQGTPTLPKRLMPLSMNSLKRSLFQMIRSGSVMTPATATASAAGSPSPNAMAFTTGDFQRELQRRRSGDLSDGGRSSSGTITIERPTTSPPPTAPNTDDEADKDASSSAAETTSPDTITKPPSNSRTMIKGKGPSGSGLRPLTKPAAPSSNPNETKRERELRERKAYLKNFWYAAALSSNLKDDKPVEIKMMGRTLVMFRDENGKPRCMENLCAHRGAPLAKGWTKKVDGHNCVVCPYHAWAFEGEGRLKDVPTSINGQLPKRPIMDAYPVEEKGGFVWLFFGSASMPAEERPPIPYIPELDDSKWRAVYSEVEFEAPHWSTFDNALDMAHIHYVHDGSFGNPNKPEIMDMDVTQNTFGLEGTFKIHNKPVNKLWEWTRVPQVEVDLKAFLPMTSAVKITLGHGIQMITFVNTVPIDEHRSINRFCLIRNFATTPLADSFVKKSMMKIIHEDKDMVDLVQPEDMPREWSLEADIPQIAFRRLRQEWVDMGYAVDPSSTKGPHGSLNM